MDYKTTLILNPAAGNGTAGTAFPAIAARLAALGFEYNLLRTTGPNDATQMAREAAESGVDLVVAVGGDGTINEVINGLMLAQKNGKPGARPALGVLPIGRGNDFAFGMNIMSGIEDAIEDLIKGERRTIDIGRVTGGDYPEGRYFGNGVGMGFDTVVGFEAAKIKWVRGAGCYLVALIQTMFGYTKFPVYELVLDDGETIRQSFMMISVMNGRRMGGAFYMAPEGNPGDGRFDLCMVNTVSKPMVLLIASKLMKGTQKEHAQVRMVQAQKVLIRTVSGTIPAHADGETLCTQGRELRIEFCPMQLDVITRSL